LGVEDGRGEVHRVLDVGRPRGAHHHHQHVVGDGDERVLEQLAANWIDVHAVLSRTMLFSASRDAVHPGDTTDVVSYSSMIAGPAMRPSSPVRVITRVSSQPLAAPKYALRGAS